MAASISFSQCPLCGSRKIRKIHTDYRRKMNNKIVFVPQLERHECPNCGEVFFGPRAMERLESSYLPKTRRKIPA